MITPEVRERIEAATVRLSLQGGRGVLVPGGYILTAAHCIAWSGEGGMALGDHHLEMVDAPSGASFRLSVHAVEPVADIAVLAEADSQQFGADADAFGAWCEEIAAVSLSARAFVQGEPVRVHVLTHDRGWITGRVVSHGFETSGIIWLEPEARIQGGTSGSPVVDDTGELIGVVSWASEDAESHGAMPVASLALPRWIWKRIEDAGDRGAA